MSEEKHERSAVRAEIDVERLWRGWCRTPFQQFLSMELDTWDKAAGEVRFRVPFKRTYKRDLKRPGYHGGVLASIIDVAADFVLAISSNSFGLPTIDLRVDYLRVTPDDDLSVVARTIKVGRSIGVADVELRDSSGRLCAVGRGTYSMASGR